MKSRRGSAAIASTTPAAAAARHPAAESLNAPKRNAEPAPAPTKPQQDPDEGYVAVGRILGPFGLKGELKVLPLTDNADRFKAGARLWAEQQPVTVRSSREAQNHLYVTLKGFPDRRSVEKLRHALLQVPETELPPLPEGEYYRFQLVGLTVVREDGTALGTLAEIIETGSNDVYRVHADDGSDILLPALGDVILSIDLDARRIVVDPPEWR
ncbi:MAG: ribosome maturation factor RimM [Chloroflexota bacterium]|nr:ribosome maturation factor RimM [Chloroflexota bacterium]